MAQHPPNSGMAEVKPLPNEHFMSLEFPGVVKNLDKALGTLGGSSKLVEVRMSQIHSIHLY